MGRGRRLRIVRLERTLDGFTFIDLFAGIGGFRLALESLGATCVFSSEIDKRAQETYLKNFGELPSGDITKVEAEDIPEHDILCAGFPCQAFSIAGARKGFQDARGTLFFEVLRIAQAKRPKVLFLENVRHLTTHDNGRTMGIITDSLHELGYDVHAKVLSAKDYGVPQKRERIYIVCFRRDLEVDTFSFPEPVPLTKCVEDF